MWILIVTIATGAALAALYALHRRRAPARPEAVATLQFWREAVAPGLDTIARPVARLGRPWVFLLLAAVVVALGIAAAAPPAGGSRAVVVLDAGSGMRWSAVGAATPLDQAIDVIEAGLTTACPSAVVVADGRPRVVARGTDGTAAVRAALESIRPTPAGSEPRATGSAVALNLAAQLTDADIDWHTDETAVPDGVPPGAAARVHIRRWSPPAGRAAIVAVWSEPDARLSLRVARSSLRFHPQLFVDLERPGQPARSEPVAFPAAARTAGVTFDWKPGNSPDATVLLRVAGGAVVQSLPVRLPTQPTVAVQCNPAAPAALRAAADAFAGSADAAVIIAVLPQGEPSPSQAGAAIRSVSDGEGIAPGMPIAADPANPLAAGLDLEGAVTAAGPAVPRGQPILWAGGKVVASIDAAARTAYISTAVAGDAADLPRHAAFPVLVARVLRQLAGGVEMPPAVPADRLVTDPLWRSQGPTPGPIATAELAPGDPGPPSSPVATPGRLPGLNASTWALLAAVVLLCTEGLLQALGRGGRA